MIKISNIGRPFPYFLCNILILIIEPIMITHESFLACIKRREKELPVQPHTMPIFLKLILYNKYTDYVSI